LVPCFNEEGNLPELVERTERIFDRRGIAGEIILVDDGSEDGTGAEIDALAATHPRVAAVHHATNRGMAAAWKSALDRSRGRYVLTLDADLQYQPEAIPQLYREICFSKADLVQGWRSVRERKDQSLGLAVGDGAAPSPQGEEAWRRRYYRAYRTLLPVHHWAISRNAPRYLEELRRTQWLPREEVEQLQLKRLRRLVPHAEAHVGYYRELFQTAGITPESIRSLDDLRRIPVLTK